MGSERIDISILEMSMSRVSELGVSAAHDALH